MVDILAKSSKYVDKGHRRLCIDYLFGDTEQEQAQFRSGSSRINSLLTGPCLCKASQRLESFQGGGSTTAFTCPGHAPSVEAVERLT